MLLPLYEASIASALPTTILKGLSISTSKLSPYLNNLLIINSSNEYISIQHSSKKLKISLFDKLIDEREHIALVVDEYGSVSGLVTQEDMIETLLGLEIMDESDTIEDLQLLARKSWERRAKRLGIIEDETTEE